MTTFYCTHCWAEVPEDAKTCPHCGDDIAARRSHADYVEKLIAALHHAEPTTPLRAAWILGQRRERRAVPALIEIVKTANDAFLVEGAVEALGKIGGAEALHIVEGATQHPSLRVRAKADAIVGGTKNEHTKTGIGRG